MGGRAYLRSPHASELSSSTEPAHAITEASVSGHRLYSDGNSVGNQQRHNLEMS